MGYCILCLNALKSVSTNINDTIKGNGDMLIGDLIRIHFTFGEVRDLKNYFKNLFSFFLF